MLREQWRLAAKEKKEEERGGGIDLRWPLWRLMVVLAGGGDTGGEMAVAPGSGLSLFSPLLLCIFFLFFLCFSLLFFFRSSAHSLFCYAPSLFLFFLLLPPFVFIGKNRG